MKPADPVTVSALFVYPLKSARGTALQEAVVGVRGFENDRRWMVVDGAGNFVSQRTHPALALVSAVAYEDRLVLRARGNPSLSVPRCHGAAPRRLVRIWDDTCEAYSCGEAARSWMEHVLGERCELVEMPEGPVRTIGERYAPGRQVSFADAFPFLLVSEPSLADLNARLAAPVPVDRFRPNVVVRGCAPYEEDSWRSIRVGNVGFAVAKPCARCVITTVDQATGASGREPLATLATYRRVGNEVLFGQNLVHESEGVVRVGEAVTIVRRTSASARGRDIPSAERRR